MSRGFRTKRLEARDANGLIHGAKAQQQGNGHRGSYPLSAMDGRGKTASDAEACTQVNVVVLTATAGATRAVAGSSGLPA